MFAASRYRCLTLVAVVLIVAGSASVADAGWVTIQNDTGRVVVLQTSVTTAGTPKRSRPVRLLPGEQVREFHDTTSLQIEVFDGQPQDRSLFFGTLTIRPNAQTFLVSPSGQGVAVAPAGGR
jgi:hypothetical protein